jgi:hypothetical protein
MRRPSDRTFHSQLPLLNMTPEDEEKNTSNIKFDDVAENAKQLDIVQNRNVRSFQLDLTSSDT